MDRQQVFDKVLSHMRQQGVPSINERGHAAYRGNKGRKCAIGCLISDNVYRPGIEDKNVFHPLVLEALDNCGVIKENDKDGFFLATLQGSLHDDLLELTPKKAFLSQLEYNAKRLAEQFDIKYKKKGGST